MKERVCEAWPVSIPETVRRETVEAAPDLPDAIRIRENIEAGRLSVPQGEKHTGKGEEAVLFLFKAGGFDAVATDDAHFLRTLRGLGIAYAVPAVIIVKLREEGTLLTTEAFQALEALRPHISPEEHAAARLLLSERSNP